MGQFTTVISSAVAAAESSVSVVAVLFYGYMSNKLNILSNDGERSISFVCVNVFLPSLLLTEMGSRITLHSIQEFWPLVALPSLMLLLTYILGVVGVKLFRLPRYVVPGVMFNNVTSLPLLLIVALQGTGSLDAVLRPGESSSDGVARARAYVLLNSIVHNAARFALGPVMLRSGSRRDTEDYEAEEERQRSLRRNSRLFSTTAIDADETLALLGTPKLEELEEYETTWTKVWHWIKQFLNPAVIATLVAVTVGLISPLHSFIFEYTPMRTSITQSIYNIGALYPALQLYALGCKLTTKPRIPVSKKMLLFLIVVRFFLSAVLSISSVYYLRTWYPKLWVSDAMLDLVLMITPVGPPAITLAAVAEIAGSDQEEVSSVTRMLLYSYLVAPLIAPSVSIALLVSHSLHS